MKRAILSGSCYTTIVVNRLKLDKDLMGFQLTKTRFRGMVGSLMYLTASRPDLVFVVCMCARYQAKPTKKHFEAIKRVFRYLKGTINMALPLVSKDNAMSLNSLSQMRILNRVALGEKIQVDWLRLASNDTLYSNRVYMRINECVRASRPFHPTSHVENRVGGVANSGRLPQQFAIVRERCVVSQSVGGFLPNGRDVRLSRAGSGGSVCSVIRLGLVVALLSQRNSGRDKCFRFNLHTRTVRDCPALSVNKSEKHLLFNAQKIQYINPIFQISVDILKNSNFFQALTASANVPAIYLQQFWKTMSYNEKTGVYSCQLDEQWFETKCDFLERLLAITPVTQHPHLELHTDFVTRANMGRVYSRDPDIFLTQSKPQSQSEEPKNKVNSSPHPLWNDFQSDNLLLGNEYNHILVVPILLYITLEMIMS
ncbi:hypothetical protein Tco_0178695 [Tanacetum coccineum]